MNYDLFFAQVSFSDVPWDNWAFSFIEAAVSANVVQGYGATYNPTGVVTRDQMAVYLARATAGGDGNVYVPTSVVEPSFPDVLADHWAYKYIEYCRDKGVVTGFPDGTYGPTVEVNRGQMAVYIARSMANPVGDVGLAGYMPPTAPTFPDVTTTSDWTWALRYVEYIAEQEVTAGYPDGLYHPERTVTRDQMAVYTPAFSLMDQRGRRGEGIPGWKGTCAPSASERWARLCAKAFRAGLPSACARHSLPHPLSLSWRQEGAGATEHTGEG
jgi:hypothetical protein